MSFYAAQCARSTATAAWCVCLRARMRRKNAIKKLFGRQKGKKQVMIIQMVQRACMMQIGRVLRGGKTVGRKNGEWGEGSRARAANAGAPPGPSPKCTLSVVLGLSCHHHHHHHGAIAGSSKRGQQSEGKAITPCCGCWRRRRPRGGISKARRSLSDQPPTSWAKKRK